VTAGSARILVWLPYCWHILVYYEKPYHEIIISGCTKDLRKKLPVEIIGVTLPMFPSSKSHKN